MHGHRSFRLAALMILVLGLSCLRADEFDQLKVGLQPDGRIVVPTNQILKPAGKQVTFPGRPVDLALLEDGKLLVVKNLNNLVFLDVAKADIMQTLALPVTKEDPKPYFSVVGLAVVGDRIFVSDAKNHMRVAQKRADGRYEWGKATELIKPKVGGAVHPAGLAMLSKDELVVTSTRGNTVQLIDLASGLAEQIIPVGVAPFMICCPRADRIYLSNWGGNPPAEGDPQAVTSDTPIKIDPKTGVANDGTVSVLAPFPGKWKQVRTIPVGLHPSGMVLSPDKSRLYVANANSDSVSVIDTKAEEVVETISCRLEGSLPFGSGANALALSPDGKTLYVANGTNNCVAVVHLAAKKGDSRIAGLIPTGWYPGAIAVSSDGKTLFVANIKGHGSLSQPRPIAEGKATRDHLGSVSVIEAPDADQLAKYTDEVNRNNRLAYSLAGLKKPRADAKPIPIPERHGEPSVFKHVIYIIKENRTYDQVFGDMKEGNGDPHLVMFGEDVTPNHHALARQFTLFDNFYCSGVLSADGHSWCNEAYVTDYLERSFGGFIRSYPDSGTDPLAYPAAGFLWDNALAHKKTFRNYGEFIRSSFEPKDAKWKDMYKDFQEGTQVVKATATANLKTLIPYTHTGYPWFPLVMQDVYRAKIFMEELKNYETKGEFPNLVYLTLPCDHTAGTTPNYPKPKSMVADNDLALGRIVEAVSKSKFWKETCIVVIEDDPQDGFDHVDAHRTVALVISPYTKRKYVDSTQYNQTGMVKTIELILGLPPMNQLDLSATPMRKCFQDEPDLTAYTAVPNQIKLDDMNLSLKELFGKARYWTKKSMALDFNDGDAADEDTLNRILWHATRGYDTPYPEAFAGKRSE